MLVMKFGGTSVADAERISRVAKLACDHLEGYQTVVVVVSAMAGITDALIGGANLAVAGRLDEACAQVASIRDLHIRTIRRLFGQADQSASAKLLGEIEAEIERLAILYKGIAYLGELSARSLDAVSGLGELLSSRILASLISQEEPSCRWIDARQIIITDDNFGKASPIWEQLIPRTRQACVQSEGSGRLYITQGFVGTTVDGAITTLGRGGSDYTATLIGVALQAREIQIWTDVDGIMTGDPKLIPEARVLPEVSFQEASELAYFGARVLHPMTIKPAVENNIPVRILNSLSPEKPGTLIRAFVPSGEVVRAVASKKGITAVFITSPKMLMVHGFLARVFAVFDSLKIPIDLISTSEISVALTIDRTDRLSELESALGEFGQVTVRTGVAIITVVGHQFRQVSGIAASVFKALADVNIEMISGGASEINLSLVVDGSDADRAVKQLHEEFFGGQDQCR